MKDQPRSKTLKLVTITYVILALTAALYIFRCWQVQHYSDDFGVHDDIGLEKSFWLTPVLTPEPHWHANVSYGSGDLGCVTVTRCIHAYRTLYVQATGPLGVEAVDLCELQDRLSFDAATAATELNPNSEDPFAGDPFSDGSRSEWNQQNPHDTNPPRRL